MFDRDKWDEIWQTISRNKLRSFLTMLGVSWGIFLLIVVLGMARGLETGVTSGFGSYSTNSMFLWSMRTTMPYEGFKRGRWVRLDNSDTKALQENVEGVEVVAPRLQLGGWRGSNNVVYNGKTGAFNVYGDVPDFNKIEAINIIDGRWLNKVDMLENRKVCVVGTKVKSQLFNGHDPIGEYLKIQGVYYRVVGLHKPKSTANMNEGKDATIHIPFSTFQRAHNAMDRVNWYSILGKPGSNIAELEKDARALLAERHHVHPDDPLAFGGMNLQEPFEMMNMLFFMIGFIGWVVGFFTLLAGAIGVSNIMIVIIQERTKEIGVRRSLGATPRNIVGQIIMEAVVLTFVSGALGLMAGISLLEVVASLGIESDYFGVPGVDLSVAISALVILILCGLVAGWIPARRAIKISTVDALRAE